MWFPRCSSKPLLEAGFGFQRKKKRAETKRSHAQALRTGGWQLEVCAPRFGHKLGRGLGRMADTPLCLSDRRAIVYSNYWD